MSTKSWSYSSLKDYETCAHAHMYRKVVKLPEPPSYHMNLGNAVHLQAEDFVSGKLIEFPTVLDKFKDQLHILRDKGAIVEGEVVLDRGWKLLDDGWMDEKAWLRAKMDAVLGSVVIDYKTGKIYDSHKEQARLYGNIFLILHPELDEVDVEFWYINSGDIVPYVFYRKDLEYDMADWEARVEKMHNDDTYAPTPHQWCKHCYVKHLCNAYK